MGRPVADVQAAIENAGNIEVAKLEMASPSSLRFRVVLPCLAF